MQELKHMTNLQVSVLTQFAIYHQRAMKNKFQNQHNTVLCLHENLYNLRVKPMFIIICKAAISSFLNFKLHYVL